MEKEKVYAAIDHTLLKQQATWDQIREICDEALAYHTASVCIPPCYVRRAADYLAGRLPVCTVIGFPNGNSTTACKVFEAKEAVENGAEEIDMVINIGELKAGNSAYVLEEIKAIKAAIGEMILKVIIETCLLTEEEKIEMCRIVTESGADFIKTSTGFSTAGATPEDVALMRKYSGPQVRVKAAGGISCMEDAVRFLELGASRLGTSRTKKL